MKAETKFRNNVVKPFLKTLKNSFWYAIQQRGISGTPDFLGCANGKFIALELKTDEGKLSPLQERNLKRTKDAGGSSIVACPRTWEIVKTLLKMYDKQKGD